MDFCNNIDSPLEITDEEGNYKRVYKFDAINKLLDIQRSIGKISSKFILFLTVHCSFDGGELAVYLESCSHKDYVLQVRKQLKAENKNARIVRLFVLETLSTYFRVFVFIPKFLPTILYKGLRGASLIHFTVLGVRYNSPGLVPWLQDFSNLIKERFITVENENFVNLVTKDFSENDNPQINPVNFVANSETFKKYWRI